MILDLTKQELTAAMKIVEDKIDNPDTDDNEGMGGTQWEHHFALLSLREKLATLERELLNTK